MVRCHASTAVAPASIRNPKPHPMFRSLFLALGVTCCILGLEALAIDRAMLKEVANAASTGAQRVVDPPEWAPWSLLAGGAVVVLYSFTIPRRVNG